MSKYAYVMKGLRKVINGKEILKETWLSFLPGSKVGIIGPNGSGKSSLLKIMAGIDKEYEGEAFATAGMKIGYLSQDPYLDEDKTVFENIIEGLKEQVDLLNEFYVNSDRLLNKLSDEETIALSIQQGKLQEQIDALGAWNIEQEVKRAMDALWCPHRDAKIKEISGGERRRVALCKLLLEKPEMLLLDEPTNHLDAESISWLEYYLKDYKGTLIVITHDRYFLDNVTEWILEIDRGSCIPWHSNYSSWLKQKHDKLLSEDKEKQELAKQLKSELQWINKIKSSKSSINRARLNAYQELLDKKRDMSSITPNQIIIPNGPRLGELVIEAKEITKSVKGTGRILFKKLSFQIPAGAIVGIIGPNGSGKSTLLKVIYGSKDTKNPDSETIDSGTITIGETVKFGYIDQFRNKVDENKTVWEEISEGLEVIEVGNLSIKSRAYCATFGFKGGDQQKKIHQLSGGERNRMYLAKLLKRGANVLLLDEPSNDLDMTTLRALEEAILEFAGCVLVISHDRWFLDRIATHIISFPGVTRKGKPGHTGVEIGDTGVMWFEGNYGDYYRQITDSSRDGTMNRYKHKKLI